MDKWLKACKNAWDVSHQLNADKRTDEILDLMEEMDYEVIRDVKVTEDQIKISKVAFDHHCLVLEDGEDKYFLNKRRIKGSKLWRKTLFNALNIKLLYLDFKAFDKYDRKWQKMEYLKCCINNHLKN